MIPPQSAGNPVPMIVGALLLFAQSVPEGRAPVARSPYSALADCNRRGGDPADILVCGRRDDDRYRLPLHDARDVAAVRQRGEMPDALAAITPHARCGPFAGERQCSKREARAYGYGEGRDPITALSRVIGAIVDPD